VSVFFVVCSWIIGFVLVENLVLALSVCVLIAFAGLILTGVLKFRIDKKYKNVTAKELDYVMLNLPSLLMTIVPVFFVFLFKYTLADSGNLFILYFNVGILLIFLITPRLPQTFLLGAKPSIVTDSYLLNELKNLANSMGVQRIELYVIDSTKFKVANAIQIGYNKFSIVLSNLLIERFTIDELKAVLAHEIAHAKSRHVLKMTTAALAILLTGLNLLLFSRLVEFSIVLQLTMALAGFMLIVVANFLCVSYISRKFELQADLMAVKVLRTGAPLISALEKLTELNLIPRDNPRMKLGMSHPSLTERIKKIETLRLE